jgi:hypothetical protein
MIHFSFSQACEVLNIKQIIFFALFLNGVSFAQIYVSPTGSDSNPGTISQPLLSISKAMSMAKPDTTIYLRGGTYNLSATLGAGVSGTAGNYINLWAYPGETPVLDFSGEPYTGNGSPRGIELKRNYWYLKGLIIQNAADNGIYISGSYNVVDNCRVSGSRDTGIQISSGASYNYIYNCDAFGNNDPLTQGQNADGIDVKLDAGPGNVIRGCRAYDNSDDGYDCYQTSYQVVFDSCWAFHNGYNLWNITGFTGNGNGFKLGGNFVPGPHIVTNCVSFDNVIKGFDQNNNTAGVTLYNCTSYRNGTYNFSFPTAPAAGNGEDTLRNDLSFAGGWNISAGGGGDYRLNSGVVQSNDSWLGHTISESDFLSLDTSLARVTRLPDGTLPSTNFLHLAPSSGLIDSGVYIGLPYAGTAPDIGAFESGIGSSYASTNGSGGGDWNSTATWKDGIIPNDTTDVLIMSGDSVFIAAAAQCRNVLLQSDSKLNVASSLNVGGTLSLQSNSSFYNSNPSLPSFPHALSYYISNNSYYVHTKNAANMLGATGYDSTFGNVIMLRGGTAAGSDLLINGDLVVQTDDGGAFAGTRTLNLTHVIHGNVFVNSGQWSAVDSNGTNNMTGIWNVDGTVTVGNSFAPNSASIETFSNLGTSGNRTGIFNISGDLSLVSGARLQMGNNPNSTLTTELGILNLKRNFFMDKSADVATNSVGAFALNFVGNGSQSATIPRPLFTATSSMMPTTFDTVGANSSLTFANDSTSWWVRTQGTFVVNGKLALAAHDTLKGGQGFVLKDGGTLALANQNGLSLAGCIQTAGGKVFSKNATYVFNGTTPQVTGDEFPSLVNRLKIVNSSGVTLSKSLSVSDSIQILVGLLHVGNHDTLTMIGVASPSANNYIVTDGSGLANINSIGRPDIMALFPIGTESGYAPIWFSNPNTPDEFFASVKDDTSKTTNGLGRVNVKWHFVRNNYSPQVALTMQFGWMPSEEDSVFAQHRTSYSAIYVVTDTSVTEAGSGSYTTQFASQPYTVSRGGINIGTADFVVGHFTTTGVEDVKSVAMEFKLQQNYPNPFNPTTTVGFTIARNGFTTLKVYNILGQEVATLFDGNALAGKKYSTQFNAAELSSGVYFSVLKSNGEMQVHKMLLLK